MTHFVTAVSGFVPMCMPLPLGMKMGHLHHLQGAAMSSCFTLARFSTESLQVSEASTKAERVNSQTSETLSILSFSELSIICSLTTYNYLKA